MVSQVGSRQEKRIPEAILRDAKGLAILTVAKVGMVVTYNVGTGLVVALREDGSWSPPSAISSFGVGWGAQVKWISTSLMFSSQRSAFTWLHVYLFILGQVIRTVL